MKVGDVVFYAGDYRNNKSIGVIVVVLKLMCEVHWADGVRTYAYKHNLEVQ